MEQDYSALKIKVISGVQWNGAGQILGQVISLVGSVILSRLLNPDVFGLFTIMVVLGNGLNLLIGFGFNHAIIQNHQLTRNDLSSFFWINILLGFIIALVFYLSAPWIASFYGEPSILPLARIFSIVFIITAGVTVPSAQLARVLNFKKLTIINFVALIFSYAGSIFMAKSGFGIWSLFFQYISFQFITLVLTLFFSEWKPTLTIRVSSLTKVKKFVASLLPSQLVDYYTTNSDLILVGKFFGGNDLGLYGRAQAIIMLPVTNISVLLAKSFFSAFTHLQSEVDELRKNYISSVKLVALVSLPILIPVALISEEFVLIVFGEAWVKMSPFITILCVAGILGSFNGMSDALITSQGQTRLLLRIVVIEKIVFLLLIICGSFYGLLGVAIGKVLSQLFSLLFRTYKQQDILKLSFLSWLSAFRKILLSTAIMILTGILIKDFLFDYSEWMRAFLMGIILNAVFFLSLFVQNESIVFSIIKIVKEKVRFT